MQPQIIGFIDFKAAFDSIDRDRTYARLPTAGLPHQIIELLRATYDGSENAVKVRGREFPPTEIETGVKQGALSSQLLFDIVLDLILAIAMSCCRGLWLDPKNNVIDLDYANDAALMADTIEDMPLMIDSLARTAAAVDLVLSAKRQK